METTNGKIVSAVAGTLGVLHFIGQTVADLSVHAEAKLVTKYNKEATYEQVAEQRQAITMARQESILNKMDKLKLALNRAKTTETSNN